MKKLLTLVFILPLFTIGCGGDDTPEPTTSNTLNKELLYDKRWQNKSNTVVHRIHSDGTYSVNDTWEWLNDSDTMIVHVKSTGKDLKWVFNTGNTADRMEAKLDQTTSWGEYRTSW